MRNRLILTLTTTRGSRQYSLNKVVPYLLLAIAAAVSIGFVMGNVFLLKTSDELTQLERDHHSLEKMYANQVGTGELYKSELDQVSDALRQVKAERNRLQQEFSLLAVRYNGAMDDSYSFESGVPRKSAEIKGPDGKTLESGMIAVTNDSSVPLKVSGPWAESLRKLEQKMGLPAVPDMTLARALELQQTANERLFMLRGIPNGLPIAKARFSDRYGMRRHPVTGERRLHKGVDLDVAMGTPVYATADGVVEWSGFHADSGYGNLMIISHNLGFKSYYGHMKKLLIRSGSVVRKGQLIGYSGNSGLSTGPHLHYEVRYLFKALDPMPFVNWDMKNYEQIFTEVKGVSWASLRGMHPLNQTAVPLL